MKVASSAGLITQRTRTVQPKIWRQIVRDEQQLATLQPEWQLLSSQMPSRSPLHDWQYLLAWWNTFGRACPKTGAIGRLEVLVIRHDGEAVGILPFFATAKSWPSPTRLRPLGYAGWLEPYDLTEEPLVAIKPGFERVVLDEAASWIHQGLDQNKWDCAVLHWFGHDEAPKANQAWTRFRKKPGPAHVTLPDSWDKFRKGLSKSMRDNLPYYGKLLTRKGHDWRVEIADIGPDWNQAVDELVRLHRMRACLSDDPDRVDHLSLQAHRDFLDRVHDEFQSDTRSFIALLRVDGEVVGAQLFFEDTKTLVVSYSGYNQAWAKFSPLLVLQVEVIKSAIDRKVERLDLLCGEASWQERWLPKREFPINKLTIASKRPFATWKCTNYVLQRELSIYIHKTRLGRWMQRRMILAKLAGK